MNKPLLLTIVLVSASAFAQETAPPPPPPQPVASPVRPVDSPMVEEDPGGRVRWGISGDFGWHIPQSAFTFGAEGRIGYQISNMISAFAIAGFTVGLGIGGSGSATGASVSLTALSYYYFGAIAEFMLGNLFYFGGGPVLANGALAGITANGGTNGGGFTTVADAGLMPGLDLRLGLGLGRQNPAPSFRRGGFNLGVNALILLHPDTVVGRAQADSMGNVGAEVKTNELVVTVTPMLMLGYDSR